MPILQMIKEYRFDLSVANEKLTDAKCYQLWTTFAQEAPRGRGNEAISIILNDAIHKGIALRATQTTCTTQFAEYLSYLHRRACS